MTYHVGPNGKPSVCKAKKGNCPYESISPHFDTEEKAQQYSDNLNSFIAKNITTETELTKHCKIYEIADTQDMIIRLDKAKRIEKELLKQADAQYLKLEKIMKRNKRKCPTKEEFLSNFKENDSLYKAEQEKTQKIQQDFNNIIEHREQATKFFYHNQKSISDKSFSRASASSYFLFNKSSLKDTIDYLDRNGYEYKIRPDIQEAPGANFLVRLSDHNPRSYIVTNDETENIWDYTDSSILVTYMPVQEENLTDKKLRKKIKILQAKNI